MAERNTRKHMTLLSDKAEKMRVAKDLCTTSSRQHDESTLSTPHPSTGDDSILLPRPMGGYSSEESNEDLSADEYFTGAFSRDDAAAVYQDLLMTVDREDLKMMAMMLHDNYVERFGLTMTAAAGEVGQLPRVNEKTIRLWRKYFVQHHGEFSE